MRSLTFKFKLYVVAAVASAGWLAPSLSVADDDDWKTAASGTWGAGLNWVDGSTPSSIFDSASFNLSGAYTVSFNADPDPIGSLSLTSDANVTFASSARPGNPIVPRTLGLVKTSGGSGDLVMSNGSTLTLGATSGGFPSSSHPFHLTADDEIRLTDGGTLNLRFGSTIASSVLNIGGGFGPGGTLNVNGGQVQSPLSRIGSSPGVGTARISGNNSLWQADQLIVGQGGAGGFGIQNGARVQSQSGAIGSASTAGTVNISGEGSIWNTGGLDIGPFGRLDIIGGASVISSQETIIDPRGRLHLAGGTFDTQDLILENNVSFVWTFGTLRVGTCHGNLFNPAGILAPGHSAGSTTVLGNYTQQSAGILEIEIGGAAQGTQYDLVNVIGDALLGGQLDLKLISGFVPTPSQTFVIFRADTVAGAFDNVANGERLPADGGGSFLVHYGPGSAFDPTLIVLSAFQAGLAGDFDIDGDVDGGDFLLWQRGESPNPLSTGDLALWRANFGAPAGAAVPEPTTLVLICLSAMTIRRSRAPCFR